MFQRIVGKISKRAGSRADAANLPDPHVVWIDGERSPVETAEVYERWWRESSLDLLNGVVVSEASMDDFSAELISEFVRAKGTS